MNNNNNNNNNNRNKNFSNKKPRKKFDYLAITISTR